MTQGLHDFFWKNSAFRRTVYISCAFLAVIYGTVSTSVFHKPEKQTAAQIAILLVLTIVSAAAAYSLVPVLSQLRSSLSLFQYRLWDFRLALTLGTLVLSIFLFEKTRFITYAQSAYIDRRLLMDAREIAQLGNKPDWSAFSFQGPIQNVKSAVDASSRYNIPISKNAVDSVSASLGRVIAEQKIPEGSRSLVYTTYGLFNAYSVDQLTASNVQQPQSFVINSPLIFENKSFRMVGNHTPILLGDGILATQNSTIAFEGLDFWAREPYGMGLVISSNSNVVVRNSNMKNLDQSLDNATWINSSFENSRITTSGGPLRLVNVSFKNCNIDMLLIRGPAGSAELYDLIQKANGQPVTYAYEPSTIHQHGVTNTPK